MGLEWLLSIEIAIETIDDFKIWQTLIVLASHR